MNSWQKTFIDKNLNDLVNNTACHKSLLGVLSAKAVLSRADIDILDTIGSELDRSRKLYGMLQTRIHGYGVLCKALLQFKQDAAFEILWNGILSHGLHQIKINLNGTTKLLSELFGEDDIDYLKDQLNEDLQDSNIASVADVTNGIEVLRLVKNSIPHPPPFYIERSLSVRANLNPAAFKADCPDIFVLSGVERPQLTDLADPHPTAESTSQLNEITTRIIRLECDADWKELKCIASAPIHLVTFESGLYILKETTGASSVLQSFLSYNEIHGSRPLITEDELVNIHLDSSNKTGVCICDKAGIGKSFLLASLARKMTSNAGEILTAFVYLPEFFKHLSPESSPMCHDKAMERIFSYISPNVVAAKILSQALWHNMVRLILFFDGFDEIHQKDTPCAQILLEVISKKAKVFVTARAHVRGQLESFLGVLSYDILPLQETDQKQFLVKHWKQSIPNNEEKLHSFADECLRNFKKTIKEENAGILGTPIQCYLIAHIYTKQAQIYSEPTRKTTNASHFLPTTSIWKVFKLFVDGKFNSTELEAKQFHTYKALELIVPDLAEKIVRVDQHLKTKTGSMISYGLLEPADAGKHDEVVFVHRTIAEYLVAESFADILQNQSCSNLNFMEHKNDFICCFRDTILRSDKEGKNTRIRLVDCSYQDDGGYVGAHDDGWNAEVLTFRNPVVLYFLNEQLKMSQPRALTKEDRDTFCSSLHASQLYDIMYCGVYSNFVELIRLGIEFVSDASNLHEYQKFLCESPNVDFEKPVPRCCTLLNTAAEHSSVQMTELIFHFFSKFSDCDPYREFKGLSANLNTPLNIAIQKLDYDLTEYLVKKLSLESRNYLYCAIESSYWDSKETVEKKLQIIKLLIKKHPALLLEADANYALSDNGYKGPLVAWRVHLDLLKTLVHRGAWLAATFQYQTIVHRAARYMSQEDFHELCRFLIEDQQATYLFKRNPKEWKSPLHFILQNASHVLASTVQLILEIPNFNVNALDYRGNNLVISAILGTKGLQMLKLIIDAGADWEFRHKRGQTALHVATEKGQLEIVDYLLSLGLSVNDRDKCGTTPLLLAYGHLPLIKYLVDHGADLYNTDDLGNTFVHKAALELSSECFYELVCFVLNTFKDCNAGDLLKVRNKSDEMPLHGFMKTGKTISCDTMNRILDIRGMNPNVRNKDGDDLLRLALHGRYGKKVLENLVHHGADCTTRDGKDRSVLHLAVHTINEEAVSYFLSMGVDVKILDEEKRTALTQAKQKLRIQRLLQRNKYEENGEIESLDNIIAMLENAQI